ncbi:hypothetical protein PENTCL1PPCAC_1503, partial [Pristionchus entomophagus]
GPLFFSSISPTFLLSMHSPTSAHRPKLSGCLQVQSLFSQSWVSSQMGGLNGVPPSFLPSFPTRLSLLKNRALVIKETRRGQC